MDFFFTNFAPQFVWSIYVSAYLDFVSIRFWLFPLCARKCVCISVYFVAPTNDDHFVLFPSIQSNSLVRWQNNVNTCEVGLSDTTYVGRTDSISISLNWKFIRDFEKQMKISERGMLMESNLNEATKTGRTSRWRHEFISRTDPT